MRPLLGHKILVVKARWSHQPALQNTKMTNNNDNNNNNNNNNNNANIYTG